MFKNNANIVAEKYSIGHEFDTRNIIQLNTVTIKLTALTNRDFRDLLHWSFRVVVQGYNIICAAIPRE